MSAKDHDYLRTKRELTFKAQGLQLDLRLRRGHLPGDRHSCSATTAWTQALERAPRSALSTPRQYERLEVWQWGSTPKPQALLPIQPGWMKEMDKECGTAVPPQPATPEAPPAQQGVFRSCCKVQHRSSVAGGSEQHPAAEEAILNRSAARGCEGDVSVSQR